MEITPIGNNALAHFGGFGANPAQQLGMMALTLFATHMISNIPISAAETTKFEEMACEKICVPLPSGNYIETCMKKTEIAKQRTTPDKQDGGINLGMLDCDLICDPKTTHWFNVYNLLKTSFSWIFGSAEGTQEQLTKTREIASCSFLLQIPFIGKPACYSSCLWNKYWGKM